MFIKTKKDKIILICLTVFISSVFLFFCFIPAISSFMIKQNDLQITSDLQTYSIAFDNLKNNKTANSFDVDTLNSFLPDRLKFTNSLSFEAPYNSNYTYSLSEDSLSIYLIKIPKYSSFYHSLNK